MKTLVTVTCTRDKWSMILQSYSIDKFVEDPCVHFVFVEDSETSFEEWRNLLSPYYTKHCLILLDKTLVPDLYPQTPVQENLQGWQRQQLLKLNSARLINSHDYLNLDSKDIFVKPCSVSSFLKEGNDRAFVLDHRIHIAEGFKRWIHTVGQYIGVPVPKKFWGFESPFLFKTETVLKILNTIDVEDLFLKVENYQSEYLLYRFYTDQPLDNAPSRVVRFMTPEDYQNVKFLESMYNTDSVVVFTMHRKSFAHSTDLILNFLVSKGFDQNLTTQFINNAAYWHQ